MRAGEMAGTVVAMHRFADRLSVTVTRPPRADVALAVAIGLAGLLEIALTTDHPWRLAPVVLLTVAPLPWRRERPFAVLLVCLAVVAVGETVGYPGQATYLLIELIIAFYSLGAWVEFRRSAVGAAVSLGIILTLVAIHEPGLDNFTFITLVYGGAWLVGTFVRRPRLQARQLEAEAAQREAAHREAAQRAIEEERARIARELHDVVAHSVSVMVIQSGAVRHRLDGDHPREREALEGVERAGREALDEMRRMLGILRSSGDQPSLEPQPGMGELAGLAEQMRTAGLPVELLVTGDRSLPAGLGLTVYRIVQEALTNVLKHAGPARARVTISIGERSVIVEVVDDGSGSAEGTGTGHGLVGMRERVGIYGGTLTTGRREDGGFAVRAELPLTQAGTAS
jgi:signal transduction histidine kinase